MCTHTGLGSFPFARRYSGNRCFFLFLRVLRCFSSPGSLHTPMDSVHDDRSSSCRVPPFRHPRLNGYLLLPAAFRSLSRLSSALSAKASALCPILLDLSFPHHVASWCGRFYFFDFIEICKSFLFDDLRLDVFLICSFQGTYLFVIKKIFLMTNGDGEIRTLDPLLARQVLSQLSYTPIWA